MMKSAAAAIHAVFARTRNCAIIGGKRMIEIAKMIGMTPAMFTRSGRCVSSPPTMRIPRTRRAYDTGMFRCASVSATTPTIVTTARSAKTTNWMSCEGSNVTMSCWIACGTLAMIPAKMRSDIPFPTCFSEMSSPSHMRNTVPAVTVTMSMSVCPTARSGMIAAFDCRMSEMRPNP